MTNLLLPPTPPPPPDFAALLPEVLAAVDAGDSFARHILIQAGAELAALAEDVSRRLWKADDVVTFAVGGGVFQHAAAVRDSFQRELRRSVLQASVVLSDKSAAEGALVMARKLIAPAAQQDDR